MDSYKSYLVTVSISTGLLLIFIAAFNAFVDPYSFFNSPLIYNFNQEKPEFQPHARMIKAHQIRLQQPKIIILGSSRAELGLDPNHLGFSTSKDSIYNLGLSSASIYEILRYLQHAQSTQPLTQIVIGLDFFMFNANKKNQADFSEERLTPMKTGWLLDIFQALFTYDGLISSIRTIENQKNKTVIQFFASGFRNDTHNWERIKKKGSHHKAAINEDQYTLYAIEELTFFTLSQKEHQQEGLTTFQEILTFCKKNNIDLRLFISPIHARKLQLLQQIGLWDEFEKWKKPWFLC